MQYNLPGMNTLRSGIWKCSGLMPWFLVSFSMVCKPDFAVNREKSDITVVVIDAGHGGKDPGTIGRKVQEKAITLAIALKLGELIKKNYPGIKVIYTRSTDEFIELHQRAEIANQNKADLFISIHCNANKVKTFHGAETYVMGLHRSEANLDVAKQENSSILLEANYASKYDGFDPNSDESYITFTLFQNAYLDQSLEFASDVQEEMRDEIGLNDRGVRQAGFLVLYRTTMPSVLVEAGFLSNLEEENYLISAKGQNKIAGAIFHAFRKFREGIETASVKSGMHDTAGGTVKQDENKDTVKPVKETTKNDVNTIVYRVQFYTSGSSLSLSSPKFRGLADIHGYRDKNLFKYATGNCKTLEEALALQKTIQKKGFTDAFVIAFRGETRITIKEAKAISGN